MYGHEDRLLNTVATHPIIFRLNHGDTLIKPAHVLDVAEAMQRMMDAESTIGQTFSLQGPKTYSYNDIIRIAETHTLKKLGGITVPRWMASATTRLWENVWWPTISPDEVTRRYMDDKDPAPGTLGYDYLDIKPDALEDVAIIYLRRYRSSAYFDQPVQSGGVKFKRSAYHVVE
jgi:NADH dehydrogenase (ubiquinone) 1 alpha subcomplex subunit 9